MSTHGIVLIDLVGLGLIVWILNLVRTGKLYVGYAVVWLLALAGVMITVSIPSLLHLAPRIVGAIFPASALSLIAFVFIFLVLVFFSVQLSLLSRRQAELAQAFALAKLLGQEEETDQDSTVKPSS